MAKRRDLKKAVDYLSGELMMETLLYSLQPEIDKAGLEAIMARICSMSAEFRGRIQRPAGNANKQLVKQYYKKIREDFDAEADKICTELMSLNKERSEN
ncbi:MAG: hypothetical protein LBG96_08060 [Tannerella sp.]|jgi:hypothetical protein|nr:hypothetical protein [Tannerella sp.]